MESKKLAAPLSCIALLMLLLPSGAPGVDAEAEPGRRAQKVIFNCYCINRAYINTCYDSGLCNGQCRIDGIYERGECWENVFGRNCWCSKECSHQAAHGTRGGGNVDDHLCK